MQNFWKSVSNWQHYREFKGGNFFETHCRDGGLPEKKCSSNWPPSITFRCIYVKGNYQQMVSSRTFLLVLSVTTITQPILTMYMLLYSLLCTLKARNTRHSRQRAYELSRRPYSTVDTNLAYIETGRFSVMGYGERGRCMRLDRLP